MTAELSPEARALVQRLGVVAEAIGGAPAAADAGPGALIEHLGGVVADRGGDHEAWLLLTAVAGGYPSRGEVKAARRLLALAEPGRRIGAVLTAAAPTAIAVRATRLEAIAVRGVLVDVDFCARNPHNTGIQRVVRSTVPSWRGRGAVFVAWSDDGTGYRKLRPEQEELVIAWRSGIAPRPVSTDEHPLVIPIDAKLLVVEVPSRERIERLAALVEHAGLHVGMVGYDAIPIVSADLVDETESDRFAHYLSVVKHADVVVGISRTTSEEFDGFVATLPAQGLRGPRIRTVPLPEVAPPADAAPSDGSERRPLVAMIGSIEPRKNQEGVLAAATALWERGLDFELSFLGGGTSWALRRFERLVDAQRRRGHPVRLRVAPSDAELAATYRAARFVVFPSLQEGYGLPVVEALASGVPVITTKYGSTGEIAEAGGCVVVDPRDDDAIAEAMRRMLVDDGLHARLSAEAVRRPASNWTDYAARLWDALLEEAG